MNKLAMQHNAAITGWKTELEKLERKRQRLVRAITDDGVPGSAVKDDLVQIGERREELEQLLDQSEEVSVLIHPNMGERYRQEVTALVSALNEDEGRTEAATLLRSLIEEIRLTPNPEWDDLTIDLFGDLAGILSMATNKDRSLFESDPYLVQDKLVAGVGFEPTTFRL